MDRKNNISYPRIAISYPISHPLRPATEIVVTGIEDGNLGMAEFLLKFEKVSKSGIEIILERKREAARCTRIILRKWRCYDDAKM